VTTKRISFWQRLKEVSLFFAGKDKVHKTLRRLAKRLDKASIPYAIVGGMAVHAHGHHQTTSDVDVLLTAAGFAEFQRRWLLRRYAAVPNRWWRFVDRVSEVGVDVLVTGHFPRNGEPGPIAFPDPATVRETIQGIQVVNLVTLVQLKLAARRFGDLGDVAALIRCHNLNESFAKRLHPSVRAEYGKCLDEKHREEQYEAREG
jgi:hypothetical protein